jgi:hypothetical protein
VKSARRVREEALNMGHPVKRDWGGRIKPEMPQPGTLCWLALQLCKTL